MNFDETSEMLSRWSQRVHDACGVAKVIGAQLVDQCSTEEHGVDANVAAAAVASLLDQFVERETDPDCRLYVVEHALDYVLGLEVQRVDELITELHGLLVDWEHTCVQPFEWNDCDNQAYAIILPDLRDKDRKSFVLSSQSRPIIWYRESTDFRTKIHVRRADGLWWGAGEKLRPVDDYVSSDMSMKYGDCRDTGYVFTGEWGNPPYASYAKIERGAECFPGVQYALFDLRTTLDACRKGV